jgi:hypothetical protein
MRASPEIVDNTGTAGRHVNANDRAALPKKAVGEATAVLSVKDHLISEQRRERVRLT